MDVELNNNNINCPRMLNVWRSCANVNANYDENILYIYILKKYLHLFFVNTHIHMLMFQVLMITFNNKNNNLCEWLK